MILTLLATIGLTHIIVHGKIMERPKKILEKWPTLLYLANCYQCSGFWVGVVCGAISGAAWYEALLYGGAGSFLSTFAVAVLNRLER